MPLLHRWLGKTFAPTLYRVQKEKKIASQFKFSFPLAKATQITKCAFFPLARNAIEGKEASKDQDPELCRNLWKDLRAGKNTDNI